MCEPTTLLLVSTGLSIIGGVQQYQAAKAEGEYAEAVANENAKINDLRAEQAAQIGNIEEERQRRRVRQMLGSQRAAFAANNVDMGTGTAVEVLGDTAGFGEADALAIRSNALREAWGFRVGAMDDRARGRAARAAGRNSAIGTLLTTGAQVAGSWANAGFGASKSASRSPAGGFMSGFGAGAFGAARGP